MRGIAPAPGRSPVDSLPNLTLLHKPPPTPPGQLTIDQSAAYLQVSRRTIQRRIAAGVLPATRLGPKITRIRQRDLDKLREKADPVLQAAKARLRQRLAGGR